jgi:hypothetical protein
VCFYTPSQESFVAVGEQSSNRLSREDHTQKQNVKFTNKDWHRPTFVYAAKQAF